MRLRKVENEPNLVRDMSNGAILETDISKLHRHRAARAVAEEKDLELTRLRTEVNELKNLVYSMLGKE